MTGPAATPREDDRRRIRVVHVLDNLNTGGTELNAVRTAERLDPDRFEVRFLCLQAHGPLRARLDAAGIPVGEIPVTSLLSASAVRRVREVAKMVREAQIDVVHAHDPYANAIAAPSVRLAGTGAVIASHRWWRDVHRPRVRMANRLAYRFAHCVLANSPAVGELVVREEGVSRRRLVVIPNFVDEEAFTPLTEQRRVALRQQVGLSDGDTAVGIVANLYPVKNHAMLLRAAGRLSGSWPRVRFVLVGEGKERETLAKLAHDLGIADRVLLPGRVAHEPGLAGVFDVTVLTSREEGFPNWVVESMAAGRAVVATNVGGVPDAVVHGETGTLVASDDDAALATALDPLLRSDELRKSMGMAGTRRARSLYHVSKIISALESLYFELAKRHVRRRYGH
jgi:glycosyltransferase involved in cell wall biosynthesis